MAPYHFKATIEHLRCVHFAWRPINLLHIFQSKFPLEKTNSNSPLNRSTPMKHKPQSKYLGLAICITMLATLAGPVSAQYTTARTSGKWDDTSIWTPSTIPDASSQVHLVNGESDPVVISDAREAAVVRVGFGKPGSLLVEKKGGLTVGDLIIPQDKGFGYMVNRGTIEANRISLGLDNSRFIQEDGSIVVKDLKIRENAGFELKGGSVSADLKNHGILIFNEGRLLISGGSLEGKIQVGGDGKEGQSAGFLKVDSKNAQVDFSDYRQNGLSTVSFTLTPEGICTFHVRGKAVFAKGSKIAFNALPKAKPGTYQLMEAGRGIENNGLEIAPESAKEWSIQVGEDSIEATYKPAK